MKQKYGEQIKLNEHSILTFNKNVLQKHNISKKQKEKDNYWSTHKYS